MCLVKIITRETVPTFMNRIAGIAQGNTLEGVVEMVDL
jgi:hypothetical protein